MISKLLLLVLGVFLALTAVACRGKIAYLGNDGNIKLVNATGSDQIALTLDAKDYYQNRVMDRVSYSAPSWSWDGRYLAWRRGEEAGTYPNFTGGTSLVVFDSLTNTTKTIDLPDRKDPFFGFAWLRDRNTLYVDYTTAEEVNTCFAGTIKGFKIAAVDVETGAVKTILPVENGFFAWQILPSPNPNLLAFYLNNYCEGAGRLCILDLTSGERRCTKEAIGFANWSPDGQKLIFDTCFYLGESCGITILDATTLAETIIFPAATQIAYTGPVWSPSGDLFVYSLYKGPLGQESLGVWATSTDGSRTWKIDDGYFPADPQAFSPDGRYITYTKRLPLEKSEIWIASVDGHFKVKIADGAAPAWQPKDPSSTPTP